MSPYEALARRQKAARLAGWIKRALKDESLRLTGGLDGLDWAVVAKLTGCKKLPSAETIRLVERMVRNERVR